MAALRRFLFCGAVAAVACAATTASAITDFGRGETHYLPGPRRKDFLLERWRPSHNGANGLETNNKNNHHPPWSVPEPGVLKYWGNKFTQVELLPDGRLHFYKYCLICGSHDNDNWATPCN
jgi:hypothetical protein